MRRHRTRVSVLLSALLLVLLVPSASAKVERTDYSAFIFPAGWPDTGTTCIYDTVMTPFRACVVDQGNVTQPDHGRWTIRDMVLFDIVVSTSDSSLSGYQFATLNANLDASGNGPAWGTFATYTFANVPLFSGTFNGKFENERLGGRIAGKGLGAYAGQHLTGDHLTVDTLKGNVVGEIKRTGA